METSVTKATLSKGRVGWCLIFRHPVCRTTDGKQRLRVRRGLGTTDREQAQMLVDQLNEILTTPMLWELAGQQDAAQKYDPRVVAAFYDSMVPSDQDPWAIREESIPLPGGRNQVDGYTRVLFVGTTGAGKTTIVRQLLGTHPEVERFPSISAAKTTICDMEIVLEAGPFRAVATFVPRDKVRQYIDECVLASIIAKLDGSTERDAIRRLLEHNEQRFRLSYVLGTPELLKPDDFAELSDGDKDRPDDDPDMGDLTESDREELFQRLQSHMTEISHLADEANVLREKTAAELGIELAGIQAQDREVIQELVEDEMTRRNEFHELVDTILDDVETRFAYVSDGEFSRSRGGWPIKWTFVSTDRSSFLKVVNRFSSNYAPNFGRLLTPLVDGIRVAGPFRPLWHDDESPKLVLMDGQGLGHTADSTSSLSTSITRRFRDADAIVLVDNAAQPMQAGPCAVLQSLVSSGHESKLILAFTHFDEVKGDNLVGTEAKKNHVIGSFESVAHLAGKSFGREAESALRTLIPERIVFLSNIQKTLGGAAKLTLSELQKLLDAIKGSRIVVTPTQYKPLYDVANLVLAIQKATQEFQDRWRGILGMGSFSGIGPEHWSRVKALARRLGIFKEEEYDTLRPVADLIRLLQMHASQFLSMPVEWQPGPPPETGTARIESVDAIKREVFEGLHQLSRRRVLEERVREWISAYGHRGPGSTRVRAKDVASIYESAAPVPSETPDKQANKFLFEIRELIAECVKKGGGGLKAWAHDTDESAKEVGRKADGHLAAV